MEGETPMMRRLVEVPCVVLHRLWWVPYWNQSLFLCCPIQAMCSRSPKFAAWYWETNNLVKGEG